LANVETVIWETQAQSIQAPVAQETLEKDEGTEGQTTTDLYQ
jgi:hypothetical protein